MTRAAGEYRLLERGQGGVSASENPVDNPIDLDQSTFELIPGTEVCTPDGGPAINWTRPTWSPSGTQIAFASNENVDYPGEVDYDIYRISSDSISLEDGGPIVANTENTFEDDDPYWGGAVLGTP